MEKGGGADATASRCSKVQPLGHAWKARLALGARRKQVRTRESLHVGDGKTQPGDGGQAVLAGQSSRQSRKSRIGDYLHRGCGRGSRRRKRHTCRGGLDEPVGPYIETTGARSMSQAGAQGVWKRVSAEKGVVRGGLVYHRKWLLGKKGEEVQLRPRWHAGIGRPRRPALLQS